MAIFSAIGTFVAGLFGLGATAASIIGGALAFGAKYLVNSYLNRKKRRSYSAVAGESDIGGAVPVSTLFGLGKTVGHRVYYAKYGPGNKYNAEVFRLAHGWCDGLEPYIYMFGRKYDLVERAIIGNEVKHYGVVGFDDLISIRFYDGRPGQQADAKLVADTAALPQKWKATSRGTGLTYVVVEREYNEEKFPSGARPNFEFVLRGLREYDARKDSTVVGGSGPQRIDDPSTWTFSKNPAVHRFNYQLGLRGRVSGRALIGEGKTLGQLDLSSYFAAMNVCDTVRPNGKKTYECGLWANSDDDHTEIMREFDDAMAGYGLNRRGLSGVLAGAPQIPVLTITKDDISAERSGEIRYRKGSFDLYNHLSGQFTSIEKMWEPESLKPIVVNADVAADKKARSTSNDFLQVTDPDIGQYLLNIRYRQQRKGGKATIPVSRRVGFRVMEGDWVALNNRVWLVTGWNCNPKLQVSLELAETGADIYAEGGIQPGPIVVPAPPQINPSLLSTVQNFRVEVGTQQGGNGEEVPALRFLWDAPEDPTITQVRFFYFAGEDPSFATIVEDLTTDVEKGEYITTKGVRSYSKYTAKATITTVPDRFKTFTPWVTTELLTGPTELFPPKLREQVDKFINDSLNLVGEDMRQLRDRLMRSENLLTEIGARNVRDKGELRRSITSSYGGLKASFDERIATVVTDLGAAVSKVTVLEAAMQGYTGTRAVASAFEATTAQVELVKGQLTAQSNLIQQVDAKVGNVYASGKVRIFSTATESGATNTVAIASEASAGGPPTTAMLTISATAGGGGFVSVFADGFFIKGPNGARVNPIVFDGAGNAYFNVVNAGTIRTGLFLSPDSRFQQNLSAGSIEWYQ